MHLRVERRRTKRRGTTLRFSLVQSYRRNGTPQRRTVAYIASLSEAMLDWRTPKDLGRRIEAAEHLLRFWNTAKKTVFTRGFSWPEIETKISRRVPLPTCVELESLQEVRDLAESWKKKGANAFDKAVQELGEELFDKRTISLIRGHLLASVQEVDVARYHAHANSRRRSDGQCFAE